MSNKPGSATSLVLVLLLGAGVTVVSFVVNFPERRQRLRADNERMASTLLKTLASAEADLRAHDRDRNNVPDFWTADVAGLADLGLIDRGLAAADPRPLVPVPSGPVPYNGYYFAALDVDHSQTPPLEYRQDTDGKSGKVHNLHRFGFVAYPAEPGRSGNYIFILNENNTQFRADVSRTPIPRAWPSDTELMQSWSKPH